MWLCGLVAASIAKASTIREGVDVFHSASVTGDARTTSTTNVKYGVIKHFNKPSKLVVSEQLIMLELNIPAEAHEALRDAEHLLLKSKEKTAGYQWGKIPLLRITAIMNSIKHLNETHESMRSRTKRGWFDAVGNFLKISTGVATESDLNALKELYMEDNEKISLNVNKLIIHNKVLSDAIEKLTNASRIQKDLLIETTNRDILWHRISDAISLASELVQLSETLSLQYKYTADKLRSGIIPKSLMNKAVFSKFVANNSSSFDKTVDIDFLTIKPTKAEHKFVVTMPVLSTNAFNLYEFRPCPVLSKNNQALVMVKNYHRFVGISVNSYFLSNDKPTCIDKFEKQYSVCTTNLKFYNFKVKSCSVSMILNKENPEACKLERYNGNNQFFVDKTGDSFIIKFFAPTKIVVTCSGKKTFRKLKGVIVLNPPCLLESDVLTIVTNNKLFEKAKITIKNWDTSHFLDSDLQWDDVEFTNEELGKIQKLNATLEKALRINITDLHKADVVHTTLINTHFVVSYSVVGILLLIGIVVGLVWQLRKRYRKNTIPSAPKEQELCCVHTQANYAQLRKLLEPEEK